MLRPRVVLVAFPYAVLRNKPPRNRVIVPRVHVVQPGHFVVYRARIRLAVGEVRITYLGGVAVRIVGVAEKHISVFVDDIRDSAAYILPVEVMFVCVISGEALGCDHAAVRLDDVLLNFLRCAVVGVEQCKPAVMEAGGVFPFRLLYALPRVVIADDDVVALCIW